LPTLPSLAAQEEMRNYQTMCNDVLDLLLLADRFEKVSVGARAAIVVLQGVFKGAYTAGARRR